MSEAIQLATTLGAEGMIVRIKDKVFPPYFYAMNDAPGDGPTVGMVQNKGYLTQWRRDKGISTRCIYTPLSLMRSLVIGKDNETNKLLAAEGQILRCIVSCPHPRHRLGLLKIWAVLMFRLVGYKWIERVLEQIPKLEGIDLEARGCTVGGSDMLTALIAGQEARIVLENTWYWTLQFMKDVRGRVIGDLAFDVQVCSSHVTGCTVVDLRSKIRYPIPFEGIDSALPMMVKNDEEEEFSSGSNGSSPPKFRVGEIPETDVEDMIFTDDGVTRTEEAFHTGREFAMYTFDYDSDDPHYGFDPMADD
jgi:hypothetical protein